MRMECRAADAKSLLPSQPIRLCIDFAHGIVVQEGTAFTEHVVYAPGTVSAPQLIITIKHSILILLYTLITCIYLDLQISMIFASHSSYTGRMAS